MPEPIIAAVDPDVDLRLAPRRRELRRNPWPVLAVIFLPVLDELIGEGLVIVDPVEVIRYVGRDRRVTR